MDEAGEPAVMCIGKQSREARNSALGRRNNTCKVLEVKKSSEPSLHTQGSCSKVSVRTHIGMY